MHHQHDLRRVKSLSILTLDLQEHHMQEPQPPPRRSPRGNSLPTSPIAPNTPANQYMMAGLPSSNVFAHYPPWAPDPPYSISAHKLAATVELNGGIGPVNSPGMVPQRLDSGFISEGLPGSPHAPPLGKGVDIDMLDSIPLDFFSSSTPTVVDQPYPSIMESSSYCSTYDYDGSYPGSSPQLEMGLVGCSGGCTIIPQPDPMNQKVLPTLEHQCFRVDNTTEMDP